MLPSRYHMDFPTQKCQRHLCLSLLLVLVVMVKEKGGGREEENSQAGVQEGECQAYWLLDELRAVMGKDTPPMPQITQ